MLCKTGSPERHEAITLTHCLWVTKEKEACWCFCIYTLPVVFDDMSIRSNLVNANIVCFSWCVLLAKTTLVVVATAVGADQSHGRLFLYRRPVKSGTAARFYF